MPNIQQLKMEDMSEAYLRALCAANGFSIDRSNHDNDGYDVAISCKGLLTKDCVRRSPKLDIQLKSSYSKITSHDDGSISFQLEVKNYKTLIETDRMVPQILVVFHMHRDETLWLEHSTDWLKITKCAYWICLQGCLLSTGKCKISDFAEENGLGRFKIQFFSGSAIDFNLYLMNKPVREGREIGPFWDILPNEFIGIFNSTFLP